MLTVEYSPRGYEGHNCSQRVTVLNGEQHFQAMRPRVLVLNGEQHVQAMRLLRDARYWWSYKRHRGNAGTMVLFYKRVPPRKGRPTPQLAGD